MEGSEGKGPANYVHYIKEDIKIKIRGTTAFFFFLSLDLAREIGRSALDRQFIRPFPGCERLKGRLNGFVKFRVSERNG